MYPKSSVKEIRIKRETFYEDDDLHINEELARYLKEKELFKEDSVKGYFAYTDNNILQLLSVKMDKIVLESLFIDKSMYDKFIEELKNKSA